MSKYPAPSGQPFLEFVRFVAFAVATLAGASCHTSAKSKQGPTTESVERRSQALVTSCTNQPDGMPCDDGNACTRTDVCAAGACSGTVVPGCAAKLSVEDLGSLGGNGSAAYGINDSGVAVGF